MSKTKITIRVDPNALEAARQYARKQGTTVSRLVESYFLFLSKIEQKSLETPILNELAGSLNEEMSLDDRDYLVEKYLGNPRKGG